MSEHEPVRGRIEHPNQIELEDYLREREASERASLATVDHPGASLTQAMRDVDAARDYATRSRSQRTREAYRWQFERFATWCEARGETSLPASGECVAVYLAAWAKDGAKVSTLRQALSAISQAHVLAGFESPRGTAVVREVFSGIRREVGVRERRAAPVTVDLLRKMVRTLPDSLKGARDRALLTLGFAGALRRNELVSLEVRDLSFVGEGLEVLLRRSKNDQEGEGVTVGIPMGSDVQTCPVRSVTTWLEVSGITSGAVFRSADRSVGLTAIDSRTVARVIKATAEAAGLDASEYSGHSLRAGLATTAAKAGKPEHVIQKHGRWKTRDLLDRYVRDADLFSENAAAGIGL